MQLSPLARPVGFVLGGGGSLGAVQVGMLQALAEHKVQATLETPLAKVPVVYLPGPALHRLSPLEFHHTDMLIQGAYEAAGQCLESLEVDGPGLYGSPPGSQDAAGPDRV
ncbi:MAG TPA: hypothetical protein VFT31_10825 [Kribbella sp.]|nr:hypothetical protein [Kribbella sp.]